MTLQQSWERYAEQSASPANLHWKEGSFDQSGVVWWATAPLNVVSGNSDTAIQDLYDVVLSSRGIDDATLVFTSI